MMMMNKIMNKQNCNRLTDTESEQVAARLPAGTGVGALHERDGEGSEKCRWVVTEQPRGCGEA